MSHSRPPSDTRFHGTLKAFGLLKLPKNLLNRNPKRGQKSRFRRTHEPKGSCLETACKMVEIGTSLVAAPEVPLKAVTKDVRC